MYYSETESESFIMKLNKIIFFRAGRNFSSRMSMHVLTFVYISTGEIQLRVVAWLIFLKLKLIFLINRYIVILLSLQIPTGSGPPSQPLLDSRTINFYYTESPNF